MRASDAVATKRPLVGVTKHRLQLDLRPESVESIDRIREQIGVTSRADVIRFALALLKANCDEQLKEGKHILLKAASDFK